MSTTAKKALKVIAVLATPFVAYIAYSYWEIHQISSLCGDIHAGTQFSILPKLAKHRGVDTRWVTGGIYDKDRQSWFTYIPVGTTFGDIGCAVYYNNGVVVSAHMEGQ